MRKAFVVVPSGVEVETSRDCEVAGLADTVISHTVTVVTHECVGEAAIVAGKIIISLFLVRNCRLVKVIMPQSLALQAVVARVDEQNHLAELKPVMVTRNELSSIFNRGGTKFNIGPIGSIGEALLIADTKSGKPTVTVAGMSYVIRACERREEDCMKVQMRLPVGLTGGGVWNLDGKFVGLTLGTKKPYHRMELDMMLALPSEAVMNFAENN